MAPISFTVTHHFDAPARVVWDEMTDWTAHGRWIPATRVEIDEGDPRQVGGRFTGYTGYGPLTLVDRMEVTRFEWDDGAESGECEVAKLGPVLRGRAGFTVRPAQDGTGGSAVDWFEDVTVPYLPGFVAPVVDRLSAAGFSMGMKKLGKLLAQPSTA